MSQSWSFAQSFVASAAGPQTFVDPLAPSNAAGAAGYDALRANGRRKAIGGQSRSEDWLLRGPNRDRLHETGRDLERNFSLVAWAVQQHLNYVCDLNFFGETGDDGFDAALEALVEDWGAAPTFDAGGVHDRDAWLRLMEAGSVVLGDALALKLRDGTIQAIEGDRVRNPENVPAGERWQSGVRLDDRNRRVAYCVWNRGANGAGFDGWRIVPAQNAELLGYFRRFDQVRGVSPLASAFNSFRDTYESLDHAQARAKISNLFALMIKRAANDGAPFSYDDIDLSRGPSILDVNPEDDAKFLESNQPSNEFQGFIREVITLALKALDLPMSFYREDLTNFFGSRAALMHYQRSTRWKRRRLQTLMQRLTRWRVGLWIADGTLRVPRSLDAARLRFMWKPAGIPWWDPSKEVAGDMLAVGAGWGDPYSIALERTGETLETNLRRTVDALALAQRLAKTAGVDFRLAFTPPSTAAPPASDPAAN